MMEFTRDTRDEMNYTDRRIALEYWRVICQ